MRRYYNIIVPSIDRTGPVNVAFDLGRAAAKAGWTVQVFYLDKIDKSIKLDFASSVEKFKIWCSFTLTGVVHTHCLRPDLLAFLFKYNRKTVNITTLHNYFLDDLSFQYRWFLVRCAWFLWKRALSRFDHVVCISEAMQEYYRQLLPALETKLIYNFRERPIVEKVPEVVQHWIDEQRMVGRAILVFVGSLTERKNIGSLVDHIYQNKRYALLVCGEGTLFDFVMNKSAARDASSNILAVGHVQNPVSFVAVADCLVLPSLAEGFPLVILEAASVGVPTLMSNIAVHREIMDLGFGQVFDHLQFSDFDRVVARIFGQFSIPSSSLVELWSSGFTSNIGFGHYAALTEGD